MYENRLLTEKIEHLRGTTVNPELVILGNGKLGLVRDIVPEGTPDGNGRGDPQVAERMNRLVGISRTLQRISRRTSVHDNSSRFVRKSSIKAVPKFYRESTPELDRVKLFAEAGTTDHAGRYLLNTDAQTMTKLGMRLRVYPSHRYG